MMSYQTQRQKAICPCIIANLSHTPSATLPITVSFRVRYPLFCKTTNMAKQNKYCWSAAELTRNSNVFENLCTPFSRCVPPSFSCSPGHSYINTDTAHSRTQIKRVDCIWHLLTMFALRRIMPPICIAIRAEPHTPFTAATL